MAAIEIFIGTDNDITITLINITNITSMTMVLVRKNDSTSIPITSESGKITFTVDGDTTTANMRIEKTLLTVKGIYLMQGTVVSAGSTRGLKLDPNFLTVI